MDYEQEVGHYKWCYRELIKTHSAWPVLAPSEVRHQEDKRNREENNITIDGANILIPSKVEHQGRKAKIPKRDLIPADERDVEADDFEAKINISHFSVVIAADFIITL